MRKIHKKLEVPPRKAEDSEVECGAEYSASVTDKWVDTTCEKCLLNEPKNVV